MERRIYIFRTGFVYLCLLSAFIFLGRHLYRLQIRNHSKLYAEAKSTYTVSKTWSGTRGIIYDRNGNPLAGNMECTNIVADLKKLPKDRFAREKIVRILSDALGINAVTLRKRFYSRRHEVVVKNYVERDLALRIRELKISGIRFIDTQKRYYTKEDLLANVLGFTNSESEGVYGIEGSWDKVLTPTSVKKTFERDRKGRLINYDSASSVDGVDGNAIYLTIDEPIQHIVELELRKMAEEFEPRFCYAVMVDPKTGAIMAMAQYPSFNANDRSSMKPSHWRNHIVSDVYDPGSTMKAIAVAGALDYGVVSLSDIVDCEQGIWYYRNRPLRDSGHKFGMMTVAEIIQKSSNIGTAKIALALGERRLYQILKRFGFGAKTGLKTNNESPGILRDLDQWDPLSITRFPIGQGISVTALQMVQAYSAIANDGKMMQLRLVDRIVDTKTNKTVKAETKLRNYVIRTEAASDIVTALSAVTTEGGTAKKAAVENYVVAGKTGTSQKLINGSYSGHDKYIASFIGFVPAKDPAFVLLVVADEPSLRSYYGGTVAGPTFSRIAGSTLRYLNIPPTALLEQSASQVYVHRAYP